MSEPLSRRDFFKKITGRGREKNTPLPESTKPSTPGTSSPVHTETNQEFKEKLSRKTFLEFLVGASLILTLPELFPKSDQVQEKTKEEKKNIVDSVQNSVEHFTQSIDWQKFDKNLSKDTSYIEAIVGQTLIRIASEIGERILKDLNIKTGNQSLTNKEVEEMLKKAPIESYVRTVIVGPLMEEWIFRLIPSAFADRNTRRKDSFWELGIPVTAIFALIHNIEDIKVGDKTTLKLHLDSIPLNQFMSGLFFWHLMRQKGFNHAVLAHMFNNNASYMLAKFFNTHLSQNTEEAIPTQLNKNI